MAEQNAKAPAFQWYPGDFRRDTGVQACTFEARSLWREMLDLMHDGQPRGYLNAGGAPITPDALARIVGVSVAKVKKLLGELEQRHVFSRTDAGVIFSRRMVRDEEKRKFQAREGQKGGSPKLGVEYNVPGFVYAMRRSSDDAIKIGIASQPAKRLYRIRQKFSDQTIELLGAMATDDMGKTEAELHARYKKHCIAGGEWFALSEEAERDLLSRLKVNDKGNGANPHKVEAPPAVAVASAVALTAGSTTKKRAPASGDAVPRTTGLDVLPKADCDELFELWTSRRGVVSYGRFRKTVLLLFQAGVTRYTTAEISDAIIAYAEWVEEQPDKEQGFCTLERFVAEIAKWVRFGKMPYVVNGEMTERGQWAGSRELREESLAKRSA